MQPQHASATRHTHTAKYVAGSALLHLLLIAVLVHQPASWIAPERLPGSEDGTKLLLTYTRGLSILQNSVLDPRIIPQQSSATSRRSNTAPLRSKISSPSPNSQPTQVPAPDSAAGADASGSGDINIALASFFPTPQPDLSVLPRGTKGDVILDIVIDAAGKIADIKMTSGLGRGIDETVIATVQQWIFQPATKNGQPVASEQELHFHYEKA